MDIYKVQHTINMLYLKRILGYHKVRKVIHVKMFRQVSFLDLMIILYKMYIITLEISEEYIAHDNIIAIADE